MIKCVIQKTRICTSCKQEFPATSEFFYKAKNGLYGLGSVCKTCEKKKHQQYYIKNKKRIQKYKRDNKEQIKKQKAIYRSKERTMQLEREAETKRRWKNPEKRRRYHKIHNWIRRRKPKQKYCTICNEYSKRIELANISGEYKKDINDYLWLCVDCHRLFDRLNQTHKGVSSSE